jgi:hypothetical protein
MEAMEGQELARAVVQECSGGQPTYEVEAYYDGEGKCYFHDGWPRFFADYCVEEGWFVLFSCRSGRREFFVCVIDDTLCCRSFTACLGVTRACPQGFLVDAVPIDWRPLVVFKFMNLNVFFLADQSQ